VFTPLATCRWQGAECAGMSRNRARFLRGPIRECLATLAFVAFFAHALIPTGFMPGVVHGRGAGFPLILCPGHAREMPEGTNPYTRHGGSRHEAPICPFAAAGVLGAPPSFASAPVAAVAELSPGPVESPSRTTHLSGPPRTQSPRAPPSLNS
jgi:hypothetical protein